MDWTASGREAEHASIFFFLDDDDAHRRRFPSVRHSVCICTLSTHTNRAVVRRHGDGGTNIPLDNAGESFWWLQFTEKDWKSADICHLRRKVQLRELLLVLGTEPSDGNQQNDDDGGSSSKTVFSLAPGPCPMSNYEIIKIKKQTSRRHGSPLDRRAIRSHTSLSRHDSQTISARC